MKNFFRIQFRTETLNPLLLYTEVKKSKIHGFGVFAIKDIPEGTIWWHPKREDVILVNKEQFYVLNNHKKTQLMKNFLDALLTYSYYECNFDLLIFCLDHAKYTNHSENPNSGASETNPGYCSVALRDIKKGEEITENYLLYSPCDWIEEYRSFFEPSCW